MFWITSVGLDEAIDVGNSFVIKPMIYVPQIQNMVRMVGTVVRFFDGRQTDFNDCTRFSTTSRQQL
jgi:hypothetical protein